MRLTLNTGPGKAAEIYTGSAVFQELKAWLGNLSPGTDSIFILTDKKTRSCCLERLISIVPSLQPAEVLEIPAGEKNKSLKSAEYLWNVLAGKGASRCSLLINLGGGVITDLGGFVASTFNRGIPFIHIPTSLLGMVDAAIGGKTGINLGDIKNQVGTFHHPDAIFIHTGFLGTLDSYELLSGFAEIIKIALVADTRLWEKLGSIRLHDLLKSQPDEVIWKDLISASVAIKCHIVEQDFREKNLREILNFGHTIGHAFESLSLQKNRKPLSHGHAIALGMICESYLSAVKTGFDTKDRDAIIRMIFPDYEYYPVHREDLDFMMDFIGHDKKRTGSGSRFSLLRSLGNAISGVPCEPGEIIESIDFYRTLER
ncbi:MAG TPA: 3-dehydroquinate synthase [Bacteroidales bacterium]|nr:3-dehydroquinate synthase [Bacteroidales bacterium]